MKSKKELYNSIMESVSTQVKKALNEGGGAGYTVTLTGLQADNVHIARDEKDGDPIIRFSADILPGIVEWSANGYYDSVSSEGIYSSNGDLLLDYDNEDKQVTGGTVHGYFYAEAVDDYGDDCGSDDSDLMYEDHIANILFDGFEIEKMIGAGWIHADLFNPLVLENIDVNTDSNYNDYFHIDEISIECENIVNDINWFFAHRDELEYDLRDDEEDVNESVNNKSNKHINENFTLDDDLAQVLRDFKTNIDMSEFYRVSLVDEETYEPSLQRIIDTYDPYVEEVISFIACPDSAYAEQSIKHIAQDNEWENGTEANMVVDFLYDLYDWCIEHGLRNSVNESEEQLSQSEKMDLWHKGKRDQNLKACGADKLRKNLAICKAKGYDGEAAAIKAEIKSRGLKESFINEGEIANDLEAKYGKEFADLVAGVLAQERDIDPEKDGDIMFEALVPGSGNADSLGGELLRAAERIAYRYWNDGDKAGERYGRETVNPAVRFMEARVGRQDDCNLCDLVDEIYDFVNKGYCGLVDSDYERLVMNILRETILYIILKQAWNIPNNEDMWDFKNDNEDVDRDDWDDDDLENDYF